MTSPPHSIWGCLIVTIISVLFRFFATDDGRLQFRKFAVLESYQGQGAGSVFLRHVIELARAQNVTQLWCNARVDAAPFYARFGFSFRPESFFKSDVEYKIAYLDF